MFVKRVKKKLQLNKRTIGNLNIKQSDILENGEQDTVRGGSEGDPAGITKHPKYCLP